MLIKGIHTEKNEPIINSVDVLYLLPQSLGGPSDLLMEILIEGLHQGVLHGAAGVVHQHTNTLSGL